jgi:hypothetical protein
VTRRPLLRACGVAALCVAASFAVLYHGTIGSTFAYFDAETENIGSAFAGGWLTAPTTFTVTASGNNATLKWTAGAQGTNLQAINGSVTSGGTSTTCPTTLTTIASPAYATGANTYTDTGRGIGIGGEHYCYQVASAYQFATTVAATTNAITTVAATTTTTPTNWSTAATGVVVQFPFFPYSVTPANGGSSTTGKISAGDTITIKYNNTPTSLTGGTIAVCAWTTGNKLVLGDPNATKCNSSSAVGSIGTLTLSGGRTISANANFSASTYTDTSGTIVITLAGAGTANISGTQTITWTFTTNTGLSEGSPAVTVCPSTTSGCATPTTSSSF